MRISKPKNKIARKYQTDMGFKTPGSKAHAYLLKRINILPGQHGIRHRSKKSESGKQLEEKQKLKYLFGLSERQLKNYFDKSIKKKGNTGLFLAGLLEKRLDNVVYRLGFAPTRGSARQLVAHRHIKVNDVIVKSSSYKVKTGDIISLAKEKTAKIPYIESYLSNKDIIVPLWLKRTKIKGEVKSEPNIEEIEKIIDLRSVVEFYSR